MRLHTAELVVDQHGTVARWSESAQDLLGFTASEVRGRPVTGLLAFQKAPPAAEGRCGNENDAPVVLRRRDGRAQACHLCVRPADYFPGGWSVTLTPVDAQPPNDAVGHAVLDTLFKQSPSSLCVYDSDLRLRQFNPAAQGMQGVFGSHSIGLTPHEVWPDSNSKEFEVQMREVLASGVPLLGFDKRGRPPDDPDHEHIFANSIFRLEDPQGHILGLATTAVEITDQRTAEERITLLAEASAVIGTSLDVVETGQQLADVTVPRFADAATIDVFAPVISGEEPDSDLLNLRRIGLQYVGDAAVSAKSRNASHPRFPYPLSAREDLGEEPHRIEVLLPGDDGEPLYRGSNGMQPASSLVVPMKARHTVIGVVTFYRLGPGSSFSDFDTLTARDLASRTALSIDNARRYTREHNAARALQHQLLPRPIADQAAVTTRHYFAPAATGANWFDVMPVSGARVAFVLGTTNEPGLAGVASIGRLGTAVHALADLDLPPDEVLARLDSLVTRIVGQDHSPSGRETDPARTEIKCLYGVYDPTCGRLSLASAGHTPPVVAEPGGNAQALAVSVGKPLGTAERQFTPDHFDLLDGSVLAFYTPTLAGDDPPLHEGTTPDWLTGPLASSTDMPLEELRDNVLASAPGAGSSDRGAILLLARTHRLDEDHVHSWDLPSDPAIVATARSLVQRQLTVWGLEEQGFVTELVVSELVTNAIRYAEGPIHLRVIRDHHALICEVSDASTTAPHLRYARSGDEGGRGLFLIAELTQRWGTRISDTGKTIWTEQDVNEGADNTTE
ncbi:SpoIIE family protein phosphatase [Streptomyces sp. NPDC016675]|uniref:SpoIIE family protein phosphatase n=1 Tax=Streptomyces sp. NPDC016675 TaxID=3364970 RepID=UPI0036FC4048